MAQRDTGEVRFRFSGNVDEAKTHIAYGRKLLGYVKEQMAASGISHYSLTKTLEDGTTVFAESRFGQSEIRIATPTPTEPKDDLYHPAYDVPPPPPVPEPPPVEPVPVEEPEWKPKDWEPDEDESESSDGEPAGPFFSFGFYTRNSYYWTAQCTASVPVGGGFSGCVEAAWQYYFTYNDHWTGAPALRTAWNARFPKSKMPPFPTQVYQTANLYNGDDYCSAIRTASSPHNRGLRPFPLGATETMYTSGTCTAPPEGPYLEGCVLSMCVAQQSTIMDPNKGAPSGTPESLQVADQNASSWTAAGIHSSSTTHSVFVTGDYFELVRDTGTGLVYFYFWDGPQGYNLYNTLGPSAQIIPLPW